MFSIKVFLRWCAREKNNKKQLFPLYVSSFPAEGSVCVVPLRVLRRRRAAVCTPSTLTHAQTLCCSWYECWNVTRRHRRNIWELCNECKRVAEGNNNTSKDVLCSCFSCSLCRSFFYVERSSLLCIFVVLLASIYFFLHLEEKFFRKKTTTHILRKPTSLSVKK